MSMLEVSPRGASRPRGGASRAARRSRRRGPPELTVALIALASYAVFAHGAIASPAGPRLEVASAVVAIAALVAAWLGRLRPAPPRSATIGLALLAAFAAWSGLTLLWSVAPDLTWIELNRVLASVLVLGLAIVLGASSPRAVALAAGGVLALVTVVAVYALGQKLLPGVRVGSLLDLDRTGGYARLQQPLGYWNALALLLAIGAPLALAYAAGATGRRRRRVAAAVTLQLILVTGAFTYSRGGALALAAGLVVAVALGGSWPRTLVWLAASVLAAAPPIAIGLSAHAISASGVALARRESAGLLLLALVAACTILLVVGAGALLELEPAADPSPAARRRAARALSVLAGGALLAGLVAAGLSDRGVAGSVSHIVTSFTSTSGAVASRNPSRLLSAESANRWVWWKEAIGAFAARPLAGWGAGSFPVVHMLYRHDALAVLQPHSAPLQWLAETGLVGALLALGGWGLLLAAARRAVATRSGAQRALAAAVLAGAVAYAVHACYDWDWDIPGVTLPALVLLGVLAGSAPAGGSGRAPVAGDDRGGRLLALGGATLGLCAFAVSAVLPSLAASRASAALVAAASGSPATLARAWSEARAASALDPLSDAGPLAQASLALHAGAPRLARDYLLEAVSREPTDAQAWGSLAQVELQLRSARAAVADAQRALDLDPRDHAIASQAGQTAQDADLLEAPPAADALSAGALTP
jgi:tetratricopeptide (TPR) repeat protein